MFGGKGSAERGLVMAGLTVGLVIGTIAATATGALAQPSAVPTGASAQTAVLGTTAERMPASVVRLTGEVTVSVGSTGCAGPLLGSGVVMSGGLLVTAAHVAGGDTKVTVSSPSGAALVHPVLVAPGIDVASAPVPSSWPSVRQAGSDPAVGATVEIGSRARGVLRARTARVQTYLRGTGPDDPPRVMRLDIGVAPGDSGGPVLDTRGRLVGIVYAAENVSHQALVIPTSEVSAALATNGSSTGC